MSENDDLEILSFFAALAPLEIIPKQEILQHSWNL